MPLGIMEVKNINRLIVLKETHVIEALEREVSANRGRIRERMLAERGFNRDSYELRDLVRTACSDPGSKVTRCHPGLVDICIYSLGPGVAPGDPG